VALRAFVDMNGWTWNLKPDIDQAERSVLVIASGEWGEEATADWLRRHLAPPTSPDQHG
jgi:prophage maintenance system killer protein